MRNRVGDNTDPCSNSTMTVCESVDDYSDDLLAAWRSFQSRSMDSI